MSGRGEHNQTNGASLEDCHTNFFALTDVCGIKWAVYRESDSPIGLDPAEDPVLQSFGRCLQAELLAVWRRVPKVDPAPYSALDAIDEMSGQPLPQPTQPKAPSSEDKNLLCQKKELWVFWYGEPPDEMKKLISPQLQEARDISGNWENGLKYEARSLLFKALNNLIERNLLSKEFVRLGRWFVQPFDGPDKSLLHKSSHLSFAFDYFIHGESSVCASVDVRQHPPVRRLALHHLSLAKSQTSPVPVILAPYGMSATLTGVSFKSTDSSVSKLLKEWSHFYPLDRNRYYCPDLYGDLVAMPPAIEVRVAGVRLVYPTCYVLVSDMDVSGPVFSTHSNSRTMSTFNSSGGTAMTEKLEFYGSEPAPFTTSNHPLQAEHEFNELNAGYIPRRTEVVWHDALCTNPEAIAKQQQQQQQHNQNHHQQDEQQPQGGSGEAGGGGDAGSASQQGVLDYLAQWDFCNPGRIVKRKGRSRPKTEKSKDRIRFNPKLPFHRKSDLIDDLAWSFGQNDMLCANSGVLGSQGASRLSGGGNPRSMAPPGSVKDGSGLGINSPASVGPVTPGSVLTPKGPAPGSVRTPGDPMGCLASPHPPASNGPLTPMDIDCHHKPPVTPKSVPTYSPFPNVRSIDNRRVDSVKQEDQTDPSETTNLNSGVKTELKEEGDDTSSRAPQGTSQANETGPAASTNGSIISFKRPALPMKEYEEELSREDLLSDHVYDYRSMQHWLNHPVKKFRPTESRNGDPLRPIYRRNSQANVFTSELDDFRDNNDDYAYQNEACVKQEPQEGKPFLDENKRPHEGNGNLGSNDPFEFSEGYDPKKGGADKQKNDEDLFSTTGLKPSMDDLNNLFEDSSDETDNAGQAPTPPDSNKPANQHEDHIDDKTTLKLLRNSKIDPTGNLPHDQLAKMFPTPPSHEHNQITSPAEIIMDIDHHPHHIKNEPMSPPDLMEWNALDDPSSLAISSFAPLEKLYSSECPPLTVPQGFQYKPRPRNQPQASQPTTSQSAGAATSTPVGTPATKPGMSPISPLTSVDGGPRSHGPASVGTYPASAGAGGQTSSHDLASPASVSSNYMNKSINSVDPSATQGKTPEANSLILNLVLSDTLLNLYRDHNFNSCTLCVCNNEGNIRGRDASSYFPEFAGDDEVTCSCGYSAAVNRRMAHHSGLFYEDESEVTSLTEDMYFRKKPSLLLLDPKCEANDKTVGEVNRIPPALVDLIHLQSIFPTSGQNALQKYSKQYLKSSCQPVQINLVELMDANNVIFQALEQVKSASDPATSAVTKLDDAQKQSCLHRWPLLKSEGPLCSEDIIRVMGALQPNLHDSLHVKSSASCNTSTSLAVQGPLTWRQFHRMAGPSTKGNTDDQCEPLPVPVITVGHETDFLSMSPLALHYWESLSLEPFAMPRDVVYFVLCPDSDLLLGKAALFFRTLSNVYEMCRLGKHVPKTDFRDGIIRIGKKAAAELRDESTDAWFDLIGESPAACLLKLYAQVCRYYLLPLLLNITLDQSLLKKKPTKEEQMERSQGGPVMPGITAYDSSAASNPYQMGGLSNNNSFGGMDKSPMGGPPRADFPSEMNGKEGPTFSMDGPPDDSESDPPAIMIYLVDPFSFGVENLDMRRFSNLALLRCFMQMLPHLKGPIRHNIHLQIINMDSIVELSKPQSQPAMPNHLRGLAFSIYSQVQKPFQYQKDCKTLTGFGPASGVERFLKGNDSKTNFVRHLYQPPYVLAQPSQKKKITTNSDSFGSSSERSSVLFVNYCLSEDQHWLFASCCDDRGELVRSNIINVEIPNKTRRKKASARRVGLRKLMDWILSVMAMSLVPWRIVIGRIGRIGHGELRGWSVLLSRKSLKKSSKQLRDICPWISEVPSILSACLVSLEPDSSLRLMSDQFTPDERFGQTASHCQLSTPKDTTCTHILVFPTSATAQSSQKAFEDTQEGLGSNKDDIDDFGLGLDLDDLDQNDDIGGLGDLFFDDPNGGVDLPGSPGSPKRGLSDPNSPSQRNPHGEEMFRYGQEEPGERIEILQQPLALGYLVSTAKTGPMPKWFWSSCPHLENVCPVFLRSALHINQANIQQGGDDAFASNSASAGRVHSLDSSYTTDVLRYVLEGYNALSWLNLDSDGQDRRSCLPIHVQILQQIYTNFAALV
eukprot:maker-scaffold794_size96255-snap-gene-0.18 protein:Tk06785 transcript:maker-scaffold794_size96255-snap-gene-0.18-mRNA-1 annotation:"thyroid hormone receptor-associated"